MNQEQYNEIVRKEKEWIWDEILKVDPTEEFARRKTPKEILPCCYRPLTTEEREEIRDTIKDYASGAYMGMTGRIYNDKLKGLKGYSILTTDPRDAVVLAEKLELRFPVKCYIIPYVQFNGQPYSRPYSYTKLRVIWRRF